jgi:hypothetical protein
MKPCIISHIEGGLGNQFFQFAAGYALAKRQNVPFYIHPGQCYWPNDVWAKNDVCHWQLNHYQMLLNYASRQEVEALHPYFFRSSREWYVKWKRSLAKRTGQNSDNLTPQTFFLEGESSHFDERVMQLSAPYYIRGYFPSYKYFHDIRQDLVQGLTLNHAISLPGATFEQQIRACKTPIAIHFRRGDVVQDAHLQTQVSGIATAQYYQNAVHALLDTLPENSAPHFFAFSNDIAWVREHISLPAPMTLIDHSTAFMAYEDVHLMRLCHHHIIAGFSSFSWWGAYLGEHPDQQVFCTEKVSNNPLYNHPDDVFLPHWHRLPSV